MAGKNLPSTATPGFPATGRSRAVIEGITPSVDAGRFAAKRVAGDVVEVEADCFADGHDELACRVLYRRDDEAEWNETPMVALGNDRWRGVFTVAMPGRYRYTVTAWVDPFLSWRHDFPRRVDPADIRVAAVVGAELIDAAAARARRDDRKRLAAWAQRLRDAADQPAVRAEAMDKDLAAVAMRYPDRSLATTHPTEFPLVVDRERARFSTWYELFPRSCGADASTHGTLRDCIGRLEYVAKMGFDVLYLPPIHPIGRERRKGPNNVLDVVPGDVGSPWAIGAAEGGHKALHPELGTMEDFRALVARARELGLELALDIAFQCAPDHPYVRAHPQWFRWRPDGTVQYAENPPKKYQDIYPFNFESDEWTGLWEELVDVFEFWIGEGVRIFRVDNPHTKPFPFWEWAIDRLKRAHPDLIFLAEAFTRPKVMHRLAKLGFTQSYTYFTWRNTKLELTEYLTELTAGARPRLLPPELLAQYAGHPARIPADRRAPRVHGASRPRGDAVGQLRDLRARVRTARAPPARAGRGGVPRLGEIPAARLGPRARRQPRRVHRPRQCGAARQPGAAARPRPRVLPDRQRRDDLLREDRRGGR